MSSLPQQLLVVDSHTEGEPTRVVTGGGPDLGTGPLAERKKRLARSFDWLRSAVVNEPRGSDALVGALLCEPSDPSSQAGAIFFNNVGYLGMCGHGTMGLVATLAYLGRLKPGACKIDTPVGVVGTVLHESGEVSVQNVPSYRKARDVHVDVPGLGTVKGDVAWGGNWFFLVHEHGQILTLGNVAVLTGHAWRVRQAVNAAGFPEVDHVELCGPPVRPDAHSKNFVLCPGNAYDRSPCGTGTCARLACLAADGKLRPGETWVQEGITGSAFVATFERSGDAIVPTIRGHAYVNGTATLILDPRDPYRFGITTP